jgi:hypothetical protein
VCDDIYVPLAPSNVRFAFTVIGEVDRPPTLQLVSPAPGATYAPGDIPDVRWAASDPDQVTRFVVAFEPDAGGRVVLAESPGTALSSSVTLPCLGPADLPGRLVVTAYDEHGHADETTVSQAFTLRGGSCSAPLATFRAAPTPFTRSLALFAPGAGTLRVLDASGRVVRRIATAGGSAQWDGHDERGTPAGAGIYWVRFDGAAGSVTKRVVKLGR